MTVSSSSSSLQLCAASTFTFPRSLLLDKGPAFAATSVLVRPTLLAGSNLAFFEVSGMEY